MLPKVNYNVSRQVNSYGTKSILYQPLSYALNMLPLIVLLFTFGSINNLFIQLLRRVFPACGTDGLLQAE